MLASFVMVVRAVQRRRSTVIFTIDELIVLGLLVAVAVPVVPAGIARSTPTKTRFLSPSCGASASCRRRGIDNLYVAPGVVYTYPFPGALYLMALTARLGDIDPLFLYHKLRFFWGPAALVMLYLAARCCLRPPGCGVRRGGDGGGAGVQRRVRDGRRISVMVGSAGAVQLRAGRGDDGSAAGAAGRRIRVSAVRRRAGTLVLLLAATAMLVLMLTMIHIREVVQFAAYLGCFRRCRRRSKTLPALSRQGAASARCSPLSLP